MMRQNAVLLQIDFGILLILDCVTTICDSQEQSIDRFRTDGFVNCAF